MKQLKHNILLGITGSIAAYKTPELVRRLREQGAAVRIVLTKSAEDFVAPLCLEALSESRIYKSGDHLDDAQMTHIKLARWANKILIAPVSANFIAKLAHGFCDDLLSTTCLASQAPLFLAPAMNKVMWEAAATRANVDLLRARNVQFLGPTEGQQACGDIGAGRMFEVDELTTLLLSNPSLFWHNKNVVITGGPTREAIDPVRYISNHSTGHMAHALAKAVKAKGANVTLIMGPSELVPPPGINIINVQTADEMHHVAITRSNQADLFIGAAAIVDYRPKNISNQKIKKSLDEYSLHLEKTPDVIAAVAKHPGRPTIVVGFAAETENIEAHAREKLLRKNLDAIIANPVGNGRGFGDVMHEALFITRDKLSIKLPPSNKSQLAEAILASIEKFAGAN